MKTSNYIQLCQVIDDFSKANGGKAYFCLTSDLAKKMGISKSTAYRLLEDAVKNMLMFKVQTTRGTFTTNYYFASKDFLVGMGGILPYEQRKLVKQMMDFGFIPAGNVENYIGIVNQKLVHQVYEDWAAKTEKKANSL